MNNNQLKYLEYLQKENLVDKYDFEAHLCDMNMENEASEEITEYHNLSDKEFWEVVLKFAKECLAAEER